MYLSQKFKKILKSFRVQVPLHLLLNHPPFCLMNLKLTIEVQVGMIYLGWRWHIIMLNKDKTFTMFLLILCFFLVYLFEVFQLVFHVTLLDIWRKCPIMQFINILISNCMKWMWSIACTISLVFFIVASIIGEKNIWLLLLHSCIESFAIGVLRGLMKAQ